MEGKDIVKFEIKGIVANKVGFASHQNAVPILQALELQNLEANDVENVVLELSADPPFLEPKVWRIDSLRGHSTLDISDREIKLRGGFLAELAESLIGDVIIRIRRENEELASKTFPIEVLAKNQWGGCGSMPELLPAFSMPNDPAVDRILKGAADVLRRAGKSAAIDGYESKSRTRTWELVSAVWSSIAGLGISYALPPASFEESGQKIRTPGAILEGRVATCLDTALLFASALEQARLNPLLVLTKGHAFVGVWLQPQEFSHLVVDEAVVVRKRVELMQLVVFETTLITHSPVPAFSVAVEQGKRQLLDENFVMAVDIRRARMQRIRPLALSVTSLSDNLEGAANQASDALEAAPNLPAFDVEIEPTQSGAVDKITLWQRKLLDLTTRNRLLHLPETSKCVPLFCPEPALLEDRLAEGKKIMIAPIPELEAGGRDAALYNQQNRENLYEEFARDALTKSEVLSPLSTTKLETELIDLYRKARSDLDEGGANTLFLAIGFLKWKKAADDPKIYRAPLILIPIKLERRSALSGVKMAVHEDEPRFNLTLLELLRQDFELSIPGLDGPLPLDESGVDIPLILNRVRHAVKDISGFEVTTDTILGTFSFAKYLMWKDLVDRKEQLLRSPVVRLLIERDGEGFSADSDFPRPEELDLKIDPVHLFTPLPADSSQLAAVVASANGCDFVLDGPPGTGKSQTIANMIAQNLALGRRVLFVAEKMAALDVVYRRLEEKGLGEFCLEIHSNKTSKIEVLKQLERAWDTRDTMSQDEWNREATEVLRLRNQLNDVVRLLHMRHPNGLTLHQAIGLVVRDGEGVGVRLSWPRPTAHDAREFTILRDVARRLDLNLGSILEVPSAFGMINQGEWSNGWQESLVTISAEIPGRLSSWHSAKDAFLSAVGLPLAAPDDETERLVSLGRVLLKTHGIDMSFAFTADVSARVSAAQNALDLLRQYKRSESELSVAYGADALQKLNLDQLETKWADAKTKLWVLSSLAKKKLIKSLIDECRTNGTPDLERDLPVLRKMRILLGQIDATAGQINNVPGYSRLASDEGKMAAALQTAKELREVMLQLATSPDHLSELRGAIRKLVIEANDLLGTDGKIAIALSKLEAQQIEYSDLLNRARESFNLESEFPIDSTSLMETAAAIQENRGRLKAWCDWCRTRNEAALLGLWPLVQSIESGEITQGGISASFEVAYARWFAAEVIDSEPQLRNFVSAEHMSDIEAFRRLDDRLSRLSTRFIRAKLCGLIPSKNEVSRKDGFGVLKHELQKQRRHKPLRQMAVEMGDALMKLAPCMLMSPLSIAQYLPADLKPFDLVIFDEASQIAPWDAIGSIARGNQVVIAGDPRQMPPTSFFNRAASNSDDDVEEDMESILDECLGAGVPRHSLDWHYRSRHESLIAFSNYRYYDGKLITFPAAVTRASAVSWKKVAGVYAKGINRTNQLEAEALVAETLKRLRDAKFVRERKTLGIVTLNAEQQKLVADLLDKARQQFPELEPFFSDDQPEPVFVKNLETVQGDERDLIMIGVGYGPTEVGANTMSMNFGPLNRDGGWRRLNVAITRARDEMMIFTSFDPSMIDLNRTSARAVADLKHFIEFAHRGPQALKEAIHGSQGGYESPFEQAVATELIQRGWQVVPQIGVSRFRIDLGIVHPDRPGDYLVGVECDGAMYHSAATARDRDKVRAGVLHGLGWKLLRVWSTEWWVDKVGSTQRLDSQIRALLEASREENASTESDLYSVVESDPIAEAASLCPEPVPKSINEPGTSVFYQITDFSTFTGSINPDHFYESSYNEVLRSLVDHVLKSEAPIIDSLLVQRIARAHGFQRSGRLIRERVLEIVDAHFHLRADALGGSFVWNNERMSSQWSTFRPPSSEGSIRMIEEIASEELAAALQSPLTGGDTQEVARIFGIRRVSAQSKERLEAATTYLPMKIATK